MKYLKKNIDKYLMRRIIASPLIFIYSILVVMAGTIFPIPLIILICIVNLLIEPFIYILQICGCDVNIIDPHIEIYKKNERINRIIVYSLGVIIYLWLPFYIVYVFVLYGKLLFIND